MKRLFRYLNIATLLVALTAVFAACADNDNDDFGNLGLHIKVFSPTVVVPGQSMTINGSGFNDVTEIEFPGEIKVTDFEIVTNEMIRVKAPAELKQPGKIIVRNSAGEQAESRLALTLGSTVITGYFPSPYNADDPNDKAEDHILKGKETFTIYGKDMQFISSAEFINEDGETEVIPASEFVRVASGRVVIQVPGNVLTGWATVKLHTMDGKTFETPEYQFETFKSGGYWQITKRFIWENESKEPVPGWGGKFRIGLEGHDGNNECISTLDQESWDAIKEGEVYFAYKGDGASNVRITTGWWSGAYGGADFNSNELAEEDEDGNKVIKLNIKEDHNLYDLIDEQHLLFTGDAYTPIGIYVLDKVWVEGDGHFETVRTSFWKNNDTLGAASWNGIYRFGLEGHDGNNECAATFDQETWDKFMTEPIRIAIQKTGDAAPNVRVTTGWWSQDFGGKEYNWNEVAEEGEDGTIFIELNLANEEAFIALLTDQHLLFTGSDYKLVEIYQEKEVWVEGDAGPKPVVIWENDGTPVPGWGGKFRFGLDGTDGNNECCATFDADTWSIIKDGEIYFEYEGSEASNVRVTTGWWSGAYGGADYNCNPDAEDVEGGNKILKLNLKEDGNLYDLLDAQHLLFTGDAYTPVKLFYYK